MKKPIRKSLLEQILYGNIRVIGFFVLLVWIYALVSVSYYTYQTELFEKQNELNLYTDSLEKSLHQAVFHSDHIVRSAYLNKALNKEEYTTSEMIEMLTYSKEILASSAAGQSMPMIYTSNEAIFESYCFSHISNLPNYTTIQQRFQTEKTNIIFDENIRKLNEYITEVTMYRNMPSNPGNILCYQIRLQSSESFDYPTEIVFFSNEKLQDTQHYLSSSINKSLSCVMTIPKAELNQSCFQVVTVGILILVVLSVLIIFLSRNTARSALREIQQFMEQLDGEDLLYDSEFFRTEYDLHELNTIKETLHKLASDLKAYHDAIKNSELENKHLEMERLSMQLDPHMLYNSLSAIRLDAYRIKNEKILSLVDNMALYYREILKKDRKFIPVSDEIDTIRKYLYINELSHEKKYPLTTDIQPELLNLLIPPQFFHTFVENSVVHGLSGAKDDCEIKISMRKEDRFVISEIYDNGYGITPEKLTLLNEGTQDKKHIGISNSQKRMKLVFGEESSVRFESEKGKYTRVIIRFPLNKETKE
ncbi:MAG: histidine kinase [Clostridia bacterium]|nr:histidine kinase [Clostridia bacterium]